MPPLPRLDRDLFDLGPGLIGDVFGALFGLALLALAVVAVIWLVRRLRTSDTTAVPAAAPAVATSSARGILDERFARGEIDDDEYARRRSALDGR
ncbi:SHOCT domain-containing protein [Microbacterium chocolatum]|uniref:SHOCT domain-containing protein n=1 Tax=Microbacterium aurantiacum TaxID=162393 RepID=UPI00338F36E9